MMGGTSDIYIENNTINVTGYATSSSEWALVSGIEITNGDAEIYNNTIYTQNKAGYVADAPVHGVSYAQYMYGDRSLDVQNNTMYVEGDYAVKVKEGTPITVIGNYLIANELYGDDAVYNNDESVTVENNYPADLNLSVSVDNIKVGQDAVINISGYKFFTGDVTVVVNGNEETVTLTKGVGSLTVSDLSANNYTVVVSYEGTKYFNADEANATFEVSKYDSEMTVTVGDVEIDKDLTVTVAIPGLTGEVTVIVDGNEGTVSLTDGVGTYTIPAANVTYGNHTILAVFKGNEQYEANFTNANFTVEKTEDYTISVNLTVDNIDYGNDLTFNVTLPEDASGQVIVSVDGEEVAYADVVDGNATVTVPASAFTTGENEITVTYGDDKYGEKSVDFNITVNCLPVDLIVTAEDINCTEVEIITVTLPSDIDGEVTVVFQGNAYEIEMTDGVGTLEIPDLAEGTYTAEVYFEYDSVYMDNTTTVEFTVSKVEIPESVINVTVPENTTSPVVTIDLPEDATGYLLVDVDGNRTFTELVNGSAEVVIPNLAPGNYTANITYTGDAKYLSYSTTANVTVKSNVPENALTIPETSETTSPTYSISLPSDATGYLEVEVDGTKYVATLVNGSASVTVPGLSEGKHNVTVIYTGDGKYASVSKSNTLTVHVPVYKISNNKNVAVRYFNTATYKVLVTKDGKAVGAGESVTFKFNGKTYSVKTDSQGYATFKLAMKIKPKSYTITATYKGVTVKNTITVKNLIKAKNKKVKKSKKYTKVKIKLYKVNGKYLANKKIKIKFKGKTYKVKTNAKGVAKWKVKKSMVKKLTVGKKYKYKVTYGKDKVTKKLKIKK